MDDNTNWTLPTLHSTIEAPTLRADGTILDKPGYDDATGLFYDPGDVKFPAIPKNPTEAEGKAAIGRVADVLVDFPFADDEGVSESVGISLMLTAAVRRGLDTAPAFGISADDAEAGKTTLAKVAGAIMTGRDVAVIPFHTTEEMRSKEMIAALVTATPMLLFDNLAEGQAIEGASFEAVLTSANYQGRRFGKNDEEIHAPTCALIVFTAVKITAAGAATTRVLVCRLDPDKPLAERKFVHRNLIGHVIEHRPKLVADILTALRAYLVHGRDEVAGMKDTDRFPQWSDMIRGALIWYGYADPIRGGDVLREMDPVKEVQREVIRQWAGVHGEKRVTAAELCKDHALRAAFTELIDDQRHRGEVTARMISRAVPRLVGVRLGLNWGVHAFPHHPDKAQQWQLKWIGPSADDLCA